MEGSKLRPLACEASALPAEPTARPRHFNTNEVLNYIVHKRKSFEHEREIRAVIYDNNINFERVDVKALIVPIDIGNLVEEIFVNPYLASVPLGGCNRSGRKIRTKGSCPAVSGERPACILM